METVDIIREIVEGINKTIEIDSVVDNGDGTYTLLTCKTLYIQENFPITINSNDYTVTTVVKNTSIVVKGDVLPTADSFDLYAPYYFHGTVIKTKNEMETKKALNGDTQLAILPFTYLKEILRDKNFRAGSGSPFKKETDLQLFHLTYSDFTDWSTTDHYEKSVKQMTVMADLFIESANNHSLVAPFEDLPDTTTPRVNFGVYVDNGNETRIFVDQLSGVEQTLTLRFYGDDDSCCN
jgi:hypothetical protein